MPIKPENKALYPKNWDEISNFIRFERAQGQCEWMDEHYVRCRAFHGQPHPLTGSKVILTTAHLDHDPTNNVFSKSYDLDEPNNLLALCQYHHNRYDKEHRQQTQKATKRKILKESGQLQLKF